jgi:DNA/RNA-binding domain of Phe-tRNA-synthetase-like protein
MAAVNTILQSARISADIFALRPDYRALLMVVEGLPQGPSDAKSEAMLVAAEDSARSKIATTSITELPHIAAWRDAYKSFGAKPSKYRNSLEAITRRVEGNLPRVNRLTDIYNSISIKYQIPLGGEDLDKYQGAPFLIRAKGDEQFQVFSGGEPQIDTAAPGEPIWCDDAGVTCRRWNWRQGPRTALSDESTRALFIFDALEPLSDEELVKAADEMSASFKELSADVQTSYRIIRKAS